MKLQQNDKENSSVDFSVPSEKEVNRYFQYTFKNK
jgi:hypothetical protein